MTTILVNNSEYETAHFAYFAKPKVSSPVNQLKESLNISPINISSYTDHDLQDVYFMKIRSILGNPKIRVAMYLPVSKFTKFVFDRFIYLKTERLSGYFFCESIVNYTDGNSPVEVNLLMI